jgi:hypothetical protein
MMRGVTLIPIAIMAGVPVLMRPSSAFACIGAAAAVLCMAGVFLRWRPLVTAGASLALMLYALALFRARSSLVSAIVLGVSLALVLDVSEFARRFHGAVVTGPAWYRQARHWVATAVLGVVTTAALASVATLVKVSGPPTLFPILAAVGVLAAIAGLAGAVTSGRRGAPSADRQEHPDPSSSQAKEGESW